MGFYLQSKNLGHPGHVAKSDDERVLTDAQWRSVLDACEHSANANRKHWKRDYTALYLAYMTGMRIGEVIQMERRHFDDLQRSDTIHIPTLKQSERILVVCDGQWDGQPCRRRMRVRLDRAGQTHPCPRCGWLNIIPASKSKVARAIPEKDPPFVEESVIAYMADYLANHMRADQRWLFEGRKGYHLSSSMMGRIFGTYCKRAGIPPQYSFHSLRHGRGVRLWSMFQDLLLVSKGLRQRSMRSAEVYAGLDPEKRLEYKKKLEKVAFDPLKPLRKATP